MGSASKTPPPAKPAPDITWSELPEYVSKNVATRTASTISHILTLPQRLIKEVISNPLPSIGNQAIPILIVGTVLKLGFTGILGYAFGFSKWMTISDITGHSKNFPQETMKDWVQGFLNTAESIVEALGDTVLNFATSSSYSSSSSPSDISIQPEKVKRNAQLNPVCILDYKRPNNCYDAIFSSQSDQRSILLPTFVLAATLALCAYAYTVYTQKEEEQKKPPMIEAKNHTA